MRVIISLVLALCFFNSCNSNTKSSTSVSNNKELKENKNNIKSSLKSVSQEKIYENPDDDNIQFKYGDLIYKDSINNINIWNSIYIIINGKTKKISSGKRNFYTDYEQIGWYSDNKLFVYKIFHGNLNKDLSENIKNAYNTSNVFFDIEFNFHGEPLFTEDLDCYLAHNDRIRCFDKEYPEDDNNLVLIRDLIFKDVDQVISSKNSIPKERIEKYLDILEGFDFKSSTYGLLFKYLIDINNKYSTLNTKKDHSFLNESLFYKIKNINFLTLKDEPSIKNYNNLAYYLEQSKAYEEAVFLLEKITKEAPNRTVAYINLGDAYWGLEEEEKAKKAYQTYIEQMKANGKESKIPKTVLERM
ncbi:tetratricopeptide repeat protein [Aquimarina sp. M1]